MVYYENFRREKYIYWEKSPTGKSCLDYQSRYSGFGRRPRFAGNTCSSFHSSPVYFESCVICIR